MADDLLSAIQTGANVVNMAQMRAERNMQLRAQAALQAIQERHLAAQADLIAQNIQFAQAKKAKEDQDLQTFEATRKAMTETMDWGDMPPESVNAKATGAALTSLLGKNPELALKIAAAQGAIEKPELAQQAIQSRENIAAAKNETALGVANVRANSHVLGGNVPAAIATFEYRKGIESQMKDAEAGGDWDTADELKKDLEVFDRAHPDVKEKARYQALVSSHRFLQQQIENGPRSRRADYEKRKAQIEKQLGIQPGGVLETAPSLGAPGAPQNESGVLKWNPSTDQLE